MLGILHNYTHLCSGNETRKHEFGTGLYVNKRIISLIIGHELVSDRVCKIRIKHSFYSLTIITIHAPTQEKDDQMKEPFYSSLESVYVSMTPNRVRKFVVEDFNAKLGEKI
jgi:hypothetical protein